MPADAAGAPRPDEPPTPSCASSRRSRRPASSPARATWCRSAPASSRTPRPPSPPSSNCAPASPRALPASCSSPPSRARSAATRSSACARARCSAGATASSPNGPAAPRLSAASRPRSSPSPTPTAPSPPASPPTQPAPVADLPPFTGGAVGFFGYDLVRTVEPLGEPNPDELGLPDMALMVTDAMLVFDHLRHELTILACVHTDGEDDFDAEYARAAATIAEMRERLRGAVPQPAAPERRRAARVHLQLRARGLRSRGQPDRRVRPRRRRLPGRPLAALQRRRPGRGLLALPRPAHGQPLALHVLHRVRRLPDRRRLARAAGQSPRRDRRDAPDRRHLAARQIGRRGPPPRRAPDQRPEGAGRARDAGRPRPQRPRPRLRVRQRQRSTS